MARLPERWTRRTLHVVLVLTAVAAAVAVPIGVVWGWHAAFDVSYYWVAVISMVLTNDTRPLLNTPRSVLRKARP